MAGVAVWAAGRSNEVPPRGTALDEPYDGLEAKRQAIARRRGEYAPQSGRDGRGRARGGGGGGGAHPRGGGGARAGGEGGGGGARVCGGAARARAPAAVARGVAPHAIDRRQARRGGVPSTCHVGIGSATSRRAERGRERDPGARRRARLGEDAGVKDTATSRSVEAAEAEAVKTAERSRKRREMVRVQRDRAAQRDGRAAMVGVRLERAHAQMTQDLANLDAAERKVRARSARRPAARRTPSATSPPRRAARRL